MFYVEHTMKCLFFAALLLFFSACTQKDPHPEANDEIYKDLVSELDISSKMLEAEEKNLEHLIKEREKAVPQTGQIKYANKKVYDSEAAVNILKQRKQFFEIKIEERKYEAQQKYEQSLKPGGKPWPDPAEIKLYKSVAKLEREKFEWQKNKGMKKDVPRGTPAGEHGGAEKKEESEAPEH
jgi:isopenicillin N synthase-like dioxygenase